MDYTLIIPYHIGTNSTRGEMLNELLESIPDMSGLEILLVNDKSTEPWQPLKKYEKTELRMLDNNGTGKGAGAARNVGLENSRGNVIFFADSDDLFHTTIFKNILEETKILENWDMILFKMDSFGTQNPKRHLNENKHIEKAKNGSIKSLASFHPPYGRLIKKDFLNENNIRFQEISHGNDVLFGVLLATNIEKDKLIFLEEIGYSIRDGHERLTSEININSTISRMKAISKANMACTEKGWSDCVKDNLRIAYLWNNQKIIPTLKVWQKTKDYPGFHTSGWTKLIAKIILK
jgi:glycosyltransferase involved in cell wall biosynthesis